MRYDLQPDETEMRWHDRQTRRLRDDRRIGADSGLDQRARADAFEFLVGDRGNHDLTIECAARGASGSGAHCRDAALHIGRASAVESTILLDGAPRIVRHPIGADDVEVTVEHETPATRRTDPCDDIGSSRCRIAHVDLKSPRREHLGEHARDTLLAWPTRHERWITRIDSNQLPRQRDGVAARYVHCSTPSTSMVNGSPSPRALTALRT